jgi:PAS domain S-box-containing protein
MIQGELVGSLGLDAIQPREFSAAEISLAWSVADQVSGALARARLAQSQRRLSAALEQAAEAVMITDTQGTILYVNPAFERITGYSRADVVGRNPRILKSGEQDVAFYAELWATIGAGEVWHGRLVNKRKDGTPYTVDTTITPVRDEGGRVVNYISLQRDVTRDLQLEEQYRQAQKMEAVGQLTAGIAHDFNNLLTAINGFAELMQYQSGRGSADEEMAGKILDAGQRAADLVRQLLAFSRKQVIKPQVMDLNRIVAELDKLLRRIIGEHIELTASLAPDLWLVKVDPAQIEQVIVNLAVNARDAMPGGGKLTIETANVLLDDAYAGDHFEVQPGEYTLLAVSDTGVGMSQEVKAHLFEPFFTTKERDKGTGLGLSTVYGIVKQSQGHIWAYSEEGAGTTFKIYLPRTEEVEQVFSPSEGGWPLPAGHETILLVEDNDQVRDLATRVLRAQGYTVLEARDGQEALQRVAERSEPIDILLTDVVMPGMSGQALADRLVQTQPSLKTLFISGYTDEAIAAHQVLEPGVAFLQKPFGPVALARKVRAVLDSTRPEAPSERPGRGPSASD